MASLEVDVFSMASSFIEDILGSEVDEKAVSAVVGSLESQLASPSSSTSSTVKTLPILQRPSQVSSTSSSAASNASQSNNSVVATITNNTVPQVQAITGKTLYHTNSNSGAVSIPINTAINHVLSTVLSKTVTTAGGAIVTNTLGNVQGNMYKTKRVQQMIRVREQVMKLKGFFTKLTDLATDQSPEVGNAVQQLIQDVMEERLSEEAFANKFEKTLNLPSQPKLVNFLKSTLPFLRMTQKRAVVAATTVHHATPKPVKSVAVVSKAQTTTQVQSAELAMRRQPFTTSSEVNRHVPTAVAAKPRVTLPATTQQIVISNQHTQLSKTVTTAGAIATNTSGNVQGNMYKTKVHRMIPVREQIMKLKGIFTRLTKLATDQSPEIGNAVKQLIRDVMEGRLSEEAFANKFEKTLNLPSQPKLVNFLKSTLPFLRMTQKRAVVAVVSKAQTTTQVQSAELAMRRQPLTTSSEVNRHVPTAVAAKPRVTLPATTQQIVISNQHTLAQLTPQQQRQLFAQHPKLHQQLFSKTQITASKRVKKKSKKHEAKIQKLKNLKNNVERIGSVTVCFDEEFLIGTGCAGTRVYVGLHEDGSEVAVKRILSYVVKEDEKKIGNLVQLKESDNIINYREFIPGNPFCFMILDLCEETLDEYIKKLSEEELERRSPVIFREILTGLSALHCGEKKVLHRDLKPCNILVDTEGHMRLGDFGVSKMVDESQTTVDTGPKGTPGWRAAESIQKVEGAKVKFSRKSDIQVIGMICFYILTKGKHPFGDRIDRLGNIAKGDPVHLNMLTDSNAKRFVSWLISHDINKRPYVEEALNDPYLRIPHGNPFIRKNSGVNPPAKRQKTSSSTPVSSMALSSVTVDPRDTNKTPKPIKPSPSNSTGNVSSQGLMLHQGKRKWKKK